jgi:hypothetical protein
MPDNFLTPDGAAFPEVYQIEKQDGWVGGPGGLANKQGQSLANRTEWLKLQIISALGGLSGHETAADPHPQYLTSAEGNAAISAAVAALVAASPSALDTLNELAAALGNDANFSTTITNALAGKAAKDGDTGLIRTLTPAGGARVRELGDIANAATVGGIEFGTSYNCNINPATGVWAGRDVADVCWLEKWHDVATKEFWFAPTAAAGAVPVWVNVFKLITNTGDMSISGKMTAAPATLAAHLMTLGQADAKYLSSTGGDSRYGSSFLSIDGTVAANALTAVLNPCKLDFRAVALTTGTPNNRNVPADITLVIPAGATLGTVAAQRARLVLLAIDNAGTVELAITNLAGGLNLDETTLVSTTAISAAATAANVIYSTTARAGVPFRVVGFLDITEAVAGTWAVAPTTKQGIGGQALAAMGSLGFGQNWQNMTVSRVFGTTYYNITGKPILADLCWSSATGSSGITMTINGIAVPISYTAPSAGAQNGGSIIIPVGASYIASSQNSTPTLISWYELR